MTSCSTLTSRVNKETLNKLDFPAPPSPTKDGAYRYIYNSATKKWELDDDYFMEIVEYEAVTENSLTALYSLINE